MNKEIRKILDDMTLRFTSGNEVPVERAAIRRPEWEAIKSILEQELSYKEQYMLLLNKLIT